ncbi:AglZ/HisF2 family acetamidino modification protein [Achromobacter insolitus]|uniref:AglZ/HisF2 family acetamidino modification protein n=1 Tax=Achromobacter insolitus TaxID=217204 RepID=UPI000CEB3C79|nr:AglZ/HisF2 family acetamidino modification protein [Achromobacter insolitus]AVG42330.1 imidazole glycerol phosphate synthase subunit HisF [Achromobacter insolitus]CAB3943115.1 Imidazole glycerol phosphate synthase subunit HisF [Achromobacter insolitus]
MLRPRIIPCLLVRDKGLVKTVKFSSDKYVGDPMNAVRIFNEKEVDELVVVDIDATVKNEGPDLKMIERLAAECRMPFCYGGGVKTVEQARTIIGLGVEKVAISSALVEDPTLASRIAEKIGRQSVVGVMDVKKKRFSSRYEIWTHNAGKNTHLNPLEFAQVLEQHGVGEIIVNSIDHDGVMKGYDLDLVQQIRERTTVPLSVLGGAGSLADIRALISKFGIIGAGAGSLFVFKGAYKAVLINYPTPQDREVLLREANKAA